MLDDYDYLTTEEESSPARLVQHTLLRSAQALVMDKQYLAGKLIEHLQKFDQPELQQIVQKAEASPQENWLRPLQSTLAPPGGLLLLSLSDHTDQVNSVAVTSDDRWAVSASDDGSLKVWDLERGTLERTMVVQNTEGVVRPTALAITPDGKHTVAAYSDQTIRLWNLAKGTEEANFPNVVVSIELLEVTPDGSKVIAISNENDRLMWDLANGKPLRTHWSQKNWLLGTLKRFLNFFPQLLRFIILIGQLFGLGNFLIFTNFLEVNKADAVGITPDTKYAVFATRIKKLILRDSMTGKKIATTYDGFIGSRFLVFLTISGDRKNNKDTNLEMVPISAVAVTSDGKRILAASEESVSVLQVSETKFSRLIEAYLGSPKVAEFAGHDGRIETIRITPDGRYAVTTSFKTVKVWAIETGQEVATLSGHTEWVRAVAVTHNGQRVVTASADKTLKVWRLTPVQAIEKTPVIANPIEALAVKANQEQVIFAVKDNDVFSSRGSTLKEWDIKTGVETPMKLEMGKAKSVALTADGKTAVSVFKNKMKVWDVEQGKRVTTFSRFSFRFMQVMALTPDGKQAITSSWLGLHTQNLDPSCWNRFVRRGRPPKLSGFRATINVVVISADGQRALSADDKDIKVWNLTSRSEERTLSGHTETVNAVAITPDGAWAVSGAADRSCKVWDLVNGVEKRTFSDLDAALTAVTITADGQRIVATFANNLLKVWDVANGEVLATFLGESPAVCLTALAKERLIVGTEDGRIHHFILKTLTKQESQKEA